MTAVLTVVGMAVSFGWAKASLAQSADWVRVGSSINYDRGVDNTTVGKTYSLAAKSQNAERSWSASSGYVHSAPKAVAPLPIRLNQFVQQYLVDYLHAPQGLQNSFYRCSPYLSEMVQKLRHYGVPDDLVYLSFAESAFSKRGKGPWQFTSATARRYGLKINSYVDERRDPVLSTDAAARYLTDLHDASDGDWTVTLIGWNNGGRAIGRYSWLGGLDFEQFGNLLPLRTRSLLGRFMAVDFIARHARAYGIVPASLTEPPAYRNLSVRGGTSLSWLAFEHGTTIERMRELNPALLRDLVPPYARSYTVRIPIERYGYTPALASY